MRKPKGTERPGRIISLQFGLGCRRPGGGWPRARVTLRGGWGEHHSRQTASLSRGLTPVDPATSKGQGRFFLLISRQFFILFHRQHLFGAFEVEVFSHLPGGGEGDFSLGIGLKGIEEKNLISLLLPLRSWERLQQRTNPARQRETRLSLL